MSLVTELPILSDLKSYSGFITVNEDYNSNMFFWFFPAQSGNTSAPVIIWLQELIIIPIRLACNVMKTNYWESGILPDSTRIFIST